MHDTTLIRLETHYGDIVTTVSVPTVTPMPEVIIWQDRYFIRRSPTRYREADAYWVAPVKAAA